MTYIEWNILILFQVPMTNPKVSALLALANKLSKKIADDDTIISEEKNNANKQFQYQREMLQKFSDVFSRKLRAIISQLESEMGTLKLRKFDPNMLRLMAKVKGSLEEIYMSIKEVKPYPAAYRLIEYITQRNQGRDIINNLEFLATHHLDSTRPEVMSPLSSGLKHATIQSFKELRELAAKLQSHMENNQLLLEPGSNPPPTMEPRNQFADPSFLAPPDMATKA